MSESYSNDEESGWMDKIAQGDQSSARLLMQKWQRPVFNFLYRFLHDHGTAEDLTQITFVRVFQSASRYKPEAKFSTYLFTIARSLLYNEFRRQKRKPSSALEDLPPYSQDAVLSSQPESSMSDWSDWMEAALAQLPDSQREVLLLHSQQGLSYEEIASVTDQPVTTVKSLLFRARQQLKSLLVHLQ